MGITENFNRMGHAKVFGLVQRHRDREIVPTLPLSD
jgi:hypothetical protein